MGSNRDSNFQVSRRDILKLAPTGLATLAAGASSETAGQGVHGKDTRPNFVIFMDDGQRWDEMSAVGNPIIHTPNMDRVIKEGIHFRNAFVTNALCAPGRACTLTGMYSHRNGVIDNKNRPLNPGVQIFSDLLHEAGYDVVFCGKSHIKGDLKDHYWDYYFGYQGGFPSYFDPRIAEGFDGKVERPQIWPGYCDDVLAKGAVEWLEGARGPRNRPFCMFLWVYAPHEPFLRARRYEDLYNGTFIPKPKTYDWDLKGYPGKPQAFKRATNKIGILNRGDVRTLESVVKDHYAGTVDADDNLGRLMKALEQQGQLDNTAIVITADHGFFLGEWHMFDKRFMHEPSIRIPMAIRYPGFVNPGLSTEKMVISQDIAPTLLELAGVKVPPAMQGQSMVPLMKGNESGWRKDWFYEYYENPGPFDIAKHRGIRTERYKLIQYYEEEPIEYEVYDLEKDPLELDNLYGKPQYKALTQELLKRMEELREETGEV